MKKKISFLSLLLADILIIFFCIFFALVVKNVYHNDEVFFEFYRYVSFFLIYIVMISVLAYQGIYTRRYDFWHESSIIVKSSLLALVLILAFLALTKQNSAYSRIVFMLSFLFMMLLLPSFKFVFKRFLFKLGIWKKRAKILGGTSEFELNLFTNHYLGYVRAKGTAYDTLFIGSGKLKKESLNELIEQNTKDNKEILFTSMLDSHDLAKAYIFNIFNSRTNLFAIENSLQNKFNILLKRSIDLVLIILAFPILVPIFLVVMAVIKLKEPRASIFFSQKRMGLNSKLFNCLKFRSMLENGNEILKKYLQQNPDEVEYYAKFHKYKNDPRITKIGKFLRRTSLDELPQLINVLKGEMSVVGPRPYIDCEREDIGQHADIILSVLPGITGLWQVSGRSDVDFKTRIKMDVWYVRNWSIWNDVVIIIKTFKVVLKRNGAN